MEPQTETRLIPVLESYLKDTRHLNSQRVLLYPTEKLYNGLLVTTLGFLLLGTLLGIPRLAYDDDSVSNPAVHFLVVRPAFLLLILVFLPLSVRFMEFVLTARILV